MKIDIYALFPAFGIVFRAVWDTKNVSATVVFWYENANDDGYSYMNHVKVENLESGSKISSETYKNLPFENRDDNHFTYNPEKAETVTVNGDGSTYLNIYFTRNVYTVVFTNYEGPNSLVEGCSMTEHAGSTTITHIPRGNYTVTELTDWSWRYKTDDAEQSVTVAANATVTFENTRNTDQKWLGGETNKDNRFSAYTPPKTT